MLSSEKPGKFQLLPSKCYVKVSCTESSASLNFGQRWEAFLVLRGIFVIGWNVSTPQTDLPK